MFRIESYMLGGRIGVQPVNSPRIKEPKMLQEEISKGIAPYRQDYKRNNKNHIHFGQETRNNPHTNAKIKDIVNLNINQNSMLNDVEKHRLQKLYRQEGEDMFSKHKDLENLNKGVQSFSPLPEETQRNRMTSIFKQDVHDYENGLHDNIKLSRINNDRLSTREKELKNIGRLNPYDSLPLEELLSRPRGTINPMWEYLNLSTASTKSTSSPKVSNSVSNTDFLRLKKIEQKEILIKLGLTYGNKKQNQDTYERYTGIQSGKYL